MSIHDLIVLCSTIEVLLGIYLLILLIRAHELKTYWPMLLVSMWQVIPFSTLLYLRHLGKERISPMHAYQIYFYTYWTMFSVGAVSAIAVTYTILHGAMRPLRGLQSLGKIVYLWAAAISLFVAVDTSTNPSPTSQELVQVVVTHFQHATGIITISLLLFVCFAIRPMGLSPKSRIFGTAIGLGMISVVTTVEATFLVHPKKIYSLYALPQILFSCLAHVIWITYFSRPEPKRKFVLLATTSPFHAWNRIAEQFGAEPGYVAIGGVPPDAFATAEIEVFHRASQTQHVREQEDGLTPAG